VRDPNLLVGFERGDDAGVYRLSDELALIQTVDFFTPIVDDPRTFGRIAAANALSDVYAMGGRPVCAMNIVCFPADSMDLSILREILAGGLEKLHEARAVLAGGHSVQDKELKYGLAVTGVIDPARVLANQGARPGDRLVLTKPLGTGIVATALKADQAAEEAVAAMTRAMTTLNRAAAEALGDLEAHAATDITGFGFVGHAAEMIAETDLGLTIEAARVPLLPGVVEYAEQGLLPGGLHRNRSFREEIVSWDPGVPTPLRDILYDPQTSGGLLVALPEADAERLVERLQAAGHAAAAVIGAATAEHPGRIAVG
jgi:selenide,water dikinase